MHGRVSVYRVWFGKNATDVGLTSWLHENGKLLRMIRRLRQKNAKKMRLGKMIAKKMRFWKKSYFFAILKKIVFFLRIMCVKRAKKIRIAIYKNAKNLQKKCDVTEPSQKKCDVTEPSQKKCDLTEPSQKKCDVTKPSQKKCDVTEPSQKKCDLTEPSQKKCDVHHHTFQIAFFYTSHFQIAFFSHFCRIFNYW